MYREKFLPTPSARRATQQISDYVDWLDISTHALREEGDERAPPLAHWAQAFLPTPSARRATSCLFLPLHQNFNFYPRPPRGGRPPVDFSRGVNVRISTHALREEGDAALSELALCPRYFYPRPPRGGRLTGMSRWRVSQHFYPRPPRGGRRVAAVTAGSFFYFYPRPPRGGRRAHLDVAVDTHEFLPTPSARRATVQARKCPKITGDFYPRPPRGGRRSLLIKSQRQFVFLPTPSARRATRGRLCWF